MVIVGCVRIRRKVSSSQVSCSKSVVIKRTKMQPAVKYRARPPTLLTNQSVFSIQVLFSTCLKVVFFISFFFF